MKEEVKTKLIGLLSQYMKDTDECVLYPVTSADGYAEYQYHTDSKNVHVRLHRFMYEITHNVVLSPDDIICHHCDTPNCINPKHLFLGTHADNVADKVSKGRQAKGTENGRYTTGYYSKYAPVAKPKPAFENMYGRSLTEDEVRYIRERISTRGDMTLKKLSEELGIPYQRIRDINCGRIYATVIQNPSCST